jgi:hypothetical protein
MKGTQLGVFGNLFKANGLFIMVHEIRRHLLNERTVWGVFDFWLTSLARSKSIRLRFFSR